LRAFQLLLDDISLVEDMLVNRKDLCRNAEDTNEKFSSLPHWYLVGCLNPNIMQALFEIVSRCCYFDPEICAKTELALLKNCNLLLSCSRI